MGPRLRDVVVAQRMLVFRLIDRVESTMNSAELGRLRDVLRGQIAAEKAVILPLTGPPSGDVSYAGELHAVLEFMLDRMCARDATRAERTSRVRVLRDLLVHQAERDEWVIVGRIEERIGARAATAAARRFEKALEGAGVNDGQRERVGSRSMAVEGRRTGR